MTIQKTKRQKERPKYNLWQNSAYMIQEAWHRRKSVLALCVAVVLLGVAINLTELLIVPVILQKVEGAVSLRELLLTILLFSGLLLLLHSVNAYVLNNTLLGRVELRIGLVLKLNRKFSVTSFPNTEDTEILKKKERASKAVQENSAAGEAIWNTLTDLSKNLIGFGIYLALISSLEPLLVLVVTVTAVIGYLSNRRIDAWNFSHREEEGSYWGKMYYVLAKAKDTSFAKDMKIFGMRAWLHEVYEETLQLFEAFIARREKNYIRLCLVQVLMSFLRNGFAYFYLIQMALKQGFGAAQFLLYFNAVSGFSNWITGILNNFTKLHQQSTELSILREVLELPEPFRFTGGRPLEKQENGSYSITLSNVSFRYPGAEQNTLEHLNLTIKAGEKLAIVGLNGAGKTTLVKLICGLYDPTEGAVLLNGVDIREYNRQDYYRLFSAVFQQFSVLDVALVENVAQTDEEIDWKRVEDCIEKAGLTEKIKNLPGQYQTHIGKAVFEDGIELSGGEMQRLMLARALYKNGAVIVLDEPTAALDPIAENDIYLKYREMTSGCTSVYISHRLASTRFCDRIIFLGEKKILEEGTHEELMNKKGSYAELFEVQSKYYKEGGASDEEEK